ncbi:unnamed protein product [marine sediment metagenome]|uniref:C2H2-type domain-containing protein n=1 Tax=marine sediment metagenome TaxID=412755 RepID=X1USJ2_9ZZZZ
MLKCEICGTMYATYRTMVDHFNLVHDAARLPSRGAEAWLDELTSRLEENKGLRTEITTLREENKRLKEDYGRLLQKLVRLENLMSQPR